MQNKFHPRPNYLILNADSNNAVATAYAKSVTSTHFISGFN